MPPKKTLPMLLKELQDKYGALAPETAIEHAMRDLEELRASFEDLKEKHAQAGARMKGSLTSRKNGVEGRIAALERYLEGFPKLPAVPASSASPDAPSSSINVPAPPNPLPPATPDPDPTVDDASKTVPPATKTPAGDASSTAPTGDAVRVPLAAPGVALGTVAIPPSAVVPAAPDSESAKGIVPGIRPEGAPPATPTSPEAPVLPTDDPTGGTHTKPRPKPRPVAAKKPKAGASASNPLVVDEDDVKPILLVDPNMSSQVTMKLLTKEQAEAANRVLGLQASDSGASSALKRRSAGDKGGRKRVKIDENAKLQEDRSAGTGKRKSKGKGKGKEREEARAEPDLSVVVAASGDSPNIASSSNTALVIEGGGSKKVRQRAEKEPKVCWTKITIPAKILDDGEIENWLVRVPVPVGEGDQARKEFNQQGWTEIHNFTVAGTNISCAVLARAKQFRWFCREIGATSLLLIWSVFINRNKRTRCHFHAITDRASSHNDVEPKVSKTSQAAVHIVTGVGLPQDDTLVASAKALQKWSVFKPKASDHEFAGTRDAAKKIHKSIGTMTATDLLSFFRIKNGRHYLGCGCDLIHATFDFFLWKTSPFLFSDTVTGAAECIGAPWDVRLRPTLVTLFSSMGLSPDNLDSVMKYNLRGRRNDLSSAPQFVRDFWTLNKAVKAAQWARVGPPSPTPTTARPLPEFVDPDDSGSNSESGSDSDSSSEDEEPLPRRRKLAELAVFDSDGEDSDGSQGAGEGAKSGKEREDVIAEGDGGVRGKEPETTRHISSFDGDSEQPMEVDSDDDVSIDHDDNDERPPRPDGDERSSPLTSPPPSPGSI